MGITGDNFGDRMKEYEGMEADRKLMPLLPICVRLDGKGFSKFTMGLDRPYDKRMSKLMVEVTTRLVDDTNAIMGYTQSDEISLILHSNAYKSQVWFNGRIQKMTSVLASMATAHFGDLKKSLIPEKTDNLALFDCRVWNVPNKTEASNTLLWREQDATKNSISMATRSVYSHKQMHLKSGQEMQDMLMEKGINWNDYPPFFKRGTFIQRKKEMKAFSAEELDKLPEKHNARKNPEMLIERSVIRVIPMPPFGRVINRNEVVFDGAKPTELRD
jgi:tRNA(His) guanylyltransferase